MHPEQENPEVTLTTLVKHRYGADKHGIITGKNLEFEQSADPFVAKGCNSAYKVLALQPCPCSTVGKVPILFVYHYFTQLTLQLIFF